MNIGKLLSKYDLVDRIYLRKDKKAVAFASPDSNSLGFLKIFPHSKKYFEGKGVILDQILTKGLPVGGNGLFDLPNFTSYSRIGLDDSMLTITKENIENFLKNPKGDPNNVADYLNSFSKTACEAYAVNTLRNKTKNYFASISLKYNPLRYKERKQLREQIKEQIPAFVEQMIETLNQLEELTDKEIIKEYEKLMGQSFNDIINKSKEEIQKIATKKIFKNLEYTATKNIAEYTIENDFDKFVNGSISLEKTKFKGHFKLNC